MAQVDTLIIGAGAGGIATAHTLKHKLGQNSFVVVERSGAVGGTWSEEINNYPGCSVDIPSHFYSFSWNPKADWSHTYCRHPELSAYMNSTVDKFGLRQHLRLSTELVSAEWTTKSFADAGAVDSSVGFWRVTLRNVVTGAEEEITARIVVSCVGALSTPKDITIDGIDKYQGKYWHSAQWDTSYDWKGKRIAIVGNGCSATQVVPDMLADGVGSLVQFGQSRHWYMPRSDPPITPLQQALFAHIPLYRRLHRLWLYYKIDSESITMETTERAQPYIQRMVKYSKDHIRATAPSDVAESLIPLDQHGCKRRVLDGTSKGSYLAALHNPDLTVTGRAVAVDETGVIDSDGKHFDADAIVFCTGYKASEPLVPMRIVGSGGTVLADLWAKDHGAHTFHGSVPGFPNFGIVFGPNSVPSNNSCIYKIECDVEHLERVLFRPVLVEKSCSAIEPHPAVAAAWVESLRDRLTRMVWHTGCVNWYRNKHGVNTTAYPACGLEYRRARLVTPMTAYAVHGKTSNWELYRCLDIVTYWPWALFWALLCVLGDAAQKAYPVF